MEELAETSQDRSPISLRPNDGGPIVAFVVLCQDKYMRRAGAPKDGFC